MGHVAPIVRAGLLFKVKALKRSRDRNFDPIITKIGRLVGFIKIQALYKNRHLTLIDVARLSSKEKVLTDDRCRNFDLIVTKFGTHIGLIKLQIEFGDELC